MFPVLAKFADITIHTYGVMLALGFLLAILAAMRHARRTGLDPNLILDLAFYYPDRRAIRFPPLLCGGALGRLPE